MFSWQSCMRNFVFLVPAIPPTTNRGPKHEVWTLFIFQFKIIKKSRLQTKIYNKDPTLLEWEYFHSDTVHWPCFSLHKDCIVPSSATVLAHHDF